MWQSVLSGVPPGTGKGVFPFSFRVRKKGEEQFLPLGSYNRNYLTVKYFSGTSNLIQNLTAVENVELATQICREPLDPRTILDQVGLTDRAKNFPAQLSGGEQQRVAIARALAKNPKLLLCDEPTGALDYQTGKQILKLLQDTARRTGMTVIIITHNSALTGMADRIVRLKNGTVAEQIRNEHPVSVDEIEW